MNLHLIRIEVLKIKFQQNYFVEIIIMLNELFFIKEYSVTLCCK